MSPSYMRGEGKREGGRGRKTEGGRQRREGGRREENNNHIYFVGDVVSTRESATIMFDGCVKDNYALVGFFEGQAARLWSERTKEVY